MVKKLTTSKEEIKEKSLLNYLIRVATPQTRLQMKQAGFTADRKMLRELERVGMVEKTENFARNTAKKDSKGELQLGTKYYTYTYKENN